MTGNAGHDPSGTEVHRLCVFDLWLDCGHIATVEINGWSPVVVECCDRLGGTVLKGDYVPYASHVDYVNVLSERYEDRPLGTRREPTRLLGRRPRTDDPYVPPYPGGHGNAGRFPARVGAAWSLDGSVPDPRT